MLFTSRYVKKYASKTTCLGKLQNGYFALFQIFENFTSTIDIQADINNLELCNKLNG